MSRPKKGDLITGECGAHCPAVWEVTSEPTPLVGRDPAIRGDE